MKLVPPTDAVTAAAPATAQAPTPAAPVAKKPEPAFTAPQKNPAVPRDEFHGQGGMYALVNGKRVPADEDGKPLPT